LPVRFFCGPPRVPFPPRLGGAGSQWDLGRDGFELGCSFSALPEFPRPVDPGLGSGAGHNALGDSRSPWPDRLGRPREHAGRRPVPRSASGRGADSGFRLMMDGCSAHPPLFWAIPRPRPRIVGAPPWRLHPPSQWKTFSERRPVPRCGPGRPIRKDAGARAPGTLLGFRDGRGGPFGRPAGPRAIEAPRTKRSRSVGGRSQRGGSFPGLLGDRAGPPLLKPWPIPRFFGRACSLHEMCLRSRAGPGRWSRVSGAAGVASGWICGAGPWAISGPRLIRRPWAQPPNAGPRGPRPAIRGRALGPRALRSWLGMGRLFRA